MAVAGAGLLAYSIAFKVSELSKPGVLFYPACVPLPPGVTDPNYFAKQRTDVTLPINRMPGIPPGWSIPFTRLPKGLSINTKRKKPVVVEEDGGGDSAGAGSGLAMSPGEQELVSECPDHPIIQGQRMFNLGLVITGSEAPFQEGSVGFIVGRPPVLCTGLEVEVTHAELPTYQQHVMYSRVAFNSQALASVVRV